MERSAKQIWRMIGIIVMVLFGAGCATTEQVPDVRMSGFLGDYSQLHRGKRGQAEFTYHDPSADLSKYHKVILDPVQLWAANNKNSALSRLSREDQQLLVDYLYVALRDALQKDYVIVDEPGPYVMRVRCAITEARADSPVKDLLSTVTPAGLGISYAKRFLTGTHSGVGVVSVEGELLDSVTGQRLAAVVDRRAGTKSILGKPTRWGDVQDAFNFWARRMQTNLALLSVPKDQP
ncbi:MAG: DUF3313 domain-containing protein [Candidatus Omnitrophica bacterium]|nr:DUF3313 domain-containing protein [Candidatus Omnitrophota bacterium]MDD5771725.1 DUF3313 domain-containing protein [Candidatus Omnitrophota bacterium]